MTASAAAQDASAAVRWWHLPRPLLVVLGAGALNSLGVGLVLPFTLIYLNRVFHLTLASAGLVLAAATAIGMAAGLAWGTAIDAFGARTLLAVATAGQAVGLFVFAGARTAVLAVGTWVFIAAFQSATYPSQSTLFAELSTGETRSRVFAANFVLGNVFVGIGGAVAGSWLSVDVNGLPLLYVIDGITFLGLMAAVLVAVPVTRTRSRTDDDAPAEPSSWWRTVRHPAFWRLFTITFLLASIGQAAMEFGIPSIATVADLPPSYVAWAFVANTAAIAVLQPLLMRVIVKLHKLTAVQVTALVWVGSGALLAITSSFTGATLGLGLLLASAVVVALGEVVLAPSLFPLVNDLAPEAARGRFNAGTSTAFGLAFVAGPVLTTRTLGAGNGLAFFGWLLVAALGIVVTARSLRNERTEKC
jgi:MFS family permease